MYLPTLLALLTFDAGDATLPADIRGFCLYLLSREEEALETAAEEETEEEAADRLSSLSWMWLT